jgi:membrane fusion protein, multidrug efflux system
MKFLQNIWVKKNYRTSAIIAAVTLLWLSTGLLVNSSQGDGPQGRVLQEVSPSKDLTSVKARYISSSSYPLIVRVRARTEANRDVDLRAELSGRVVSVPVAKGQLVKAGEVICEQAVEDRQLRLTESESALERAQMEYDGSLRLKSGGYQSRTAIAAAKSRLGTAKASLKRRQVDLVNLKIRAPFDGIVDSRPVEVGDYMERGDTCATVLDLDPLVVSGRVSEAEVGRIPANGDITATLLTGEVVNGKVRFIQRSSDKVTRTFRVEATVTNPALALHGGITAQLQIVTGAVAAHVVPATLLSLDDEGNLGVRILDDNRHVLFVSVELIGDHPEGVWVTGLPERPLLITVGQEYVSSGEKVAVTFENITVENVSLENQAEMSAAQL